MTLATTRALLYVGACAGVLAANAVFKFDRDPGGYPDIWYPQKQAVHGLIALIITQLAIGISVAPWLAVVITVLAGYGWERTQGFVNKHDLYADALGAGAGAALSFWLRWAL